MWKVFEKKEENSENTEETVILREVRKTPKQSMEADIVQCCHH